MKLNLTPRKIHNYNNSKKKKEKRHKYIPFLFFSLFPFFPIWTTQQRPEQNTQHWCWLHHKTKSALLWRTHKTYSNHIREFCLRRISSIEWKSVQIIGFHQKKSRESLFFSTFHFFFTCSFSFFLIRVLLSLFLIFVLLPLFFSVENTPKRKGGKDLEGGWRDMGSQASILRTSKKSLTRVGSMT